MKQDCFILDTPAPDTRTPTDFASWDKVALYGTAFMASHASENQLLRDAEPYNWVVNDGRGSQQLVPYLRAAKDTKVADIRAAAARAGLRDFTDLPINNATLAAIQAREVELQAV
jgi:hypothetical protein